MVQPVFPSSFNVFKGTIIDFGIIVKSKKNAFVSWNNGPVLLNRCYSTPAQKCVWLPMARIDEWDPVADSLRTNERESFNYRQLSFTFGPALQKNKNFKLKKITILLVI